MKVACAQCYGVSNDVKGLDELDWTIRHDGTRVCKKCRPEGQSGADAKKAEQQEIAEALKLHNSVPPTPEAKLLRLEALAFLRTKGVIR